MIFINRSKVYLPKVLTSDNSIGSKELEDVISHYHGPKKNEPYKKFKAYREPSVKETLMSLFNEKCAYCESKFTHVYVGDIEHFRPKGEIEELKEQGSSKPGYYWLASNWDNLLLSCRNCNQKSKQYLPNSTFRKTIGKMNQFPISNEKYRARSLNDDLKKEDKVRLLINPCVENPEEYLQYDFRTGIIKPTHKDGFIKDRAITSIKVFGLQRIPLVIAREKKAIEISAQMQRIKEALINVNDFINHSDELKRVYYESILKREIEKLYGFLNKKEEYLGLANSMIKKFMKKNFNILIDINER